MTTTTAPQLEIKRRPIRGAIYGLMAGLGIGVELVLFAVIRFSITTVIVIAVVGMVVGILWGLVAPAKKPKGPAPGEHAFGSVFTSSRDEGPPPTYEEDRSLQILITMLEYDDFLGRLAFGRAS